MATLLDGMALARQWQEQILTRLPKTDMTLVIVQVGDDSASNTYIDRKLKLFESCGLASRVVKLSSHITTKQLIETCVELNNDPRVAGYLVQLPLPGSIDVTQVLTVISTEKDVDGLNPLNLGRLWSYQHYGRLAIAKYLNAQSTLAFDFTIPATVVGILYLLHHTPYTLKNKRVVIINKSPIVGSPLAATLLSQGARVTLMSSRNLAIPDAIKRAEVIVTAVGKPQWLTSALVPKAELIIDVGINRVENGVVGDVDQKSFDSKRVLLTPVPGGVGPLTVTALLYNFTRMISF